MRMRFASLDLLGEFSPLGRVGAAFGGCSFVYTHRAHRAGKSSLVLSQQPKWRQTGLFAHAKFQASVSSPFAALVCFRSPALAY